MNRAAKLFVEVLLVKGGAGNAGPSTLKASPGSP